MPPTSYSRSSPSSSCRASLQGADPGRGRFRDFVKGVLFHLVADHHRKRQRGPGQMAPETPDPAIDDPTYATRDQDFLVSWRDEILARGWAALERIERESKQPYFVVLRFRAEQPKLSSAEMAEQLSGRLGRPLTAAHARQLAAPRPREVRRPGAGRGHPLAGHPQRRSGRSRAGRAGPDGILPARPGAERRRQAPRKLTVENSFTFRNDPPAFSHFSRASRPARG